ncbi:hypothetical protein ACSBOB_01685 [Mesorhizobium sp. ASY16-5R]|uniref:hypothetical protein n=1 Tax=Mesorhizobium sp. ASY16-5R TaxID=3445772 RepID=UPI003FA0714E
MMEQDIVDFCSEAYKLEKTAEGYLAERSAETLAQLRGYIRLEFPQGDMSAGQKFLAEMIDDEISERERNPSTAFEDAILSFVSEEGEARDRLVDKLMALPAAQWDRSAEILGNWIERGGLQAATYARVLEEVVHARGRSAAVNQSPIEVPFG